MIVVGGEALMDVIVAPDGRRTPVPGGGPFNTARALARLGVSAAFLGRLSEDPFGRALARGLAEAGASLALASSGPEPTTVALAEIDAAGVAQYTFEIAGTSAPNLTPAMVPERLGPEVAALHVGTLGLVLEPMATTLIGLARREAGRRLVMVDPNVRPQLIADRPAYRRRLEEELWPASTIVKASGPDLDWLYPEFDVEAACARILEYGPRLVVATLGEEGALGLTGAARARVDAPRVAVVDTIGAGDVFGAALLAWLSDRDLLRGDLDPDAGALTALLRFAVQAASWSCTRAGAASPSRADLAGAGATMP